MAREEKAYARVIEKVKKMILSGELKPGEKLPLEREFAEELEVLAFTLALDRVREEALAKMEECVEKLDKNGDSKNNATLDKIIHYTLARASGNQLLIDILEACSGVFDIFIEDMRYGILKNENRKTELNECHRHLVDALREGDREKGLQALKWHFEMIDEVLG